MRDAGSSKHREQARDENDQTCPMVVVLRPGYVSRAVSPVDAPGMNDRRPLCLSSASLKPSVAGESSLSSGLLSRGQRGLMRSRISAVFMAPSGKSTAGRLRSKRGCGKNYREAGSDFCFREPAQSRQQPNCAYFRLPDD